MVRPKLCRKVDSHPDVIYFKPRGVPLRTLKESVLTVDEFEAIRLKDHNGYDQESCAKAMGISQPTFHRLISSARKNIAQALVSGHALKIEGGHFKIEGGK